MRVSQLSESLLKVTATVMLTKTSVKIFIITWTVFHREKKTNLTSIQVKNKTKKDLESSVSAILKQQLGQEFI